MNTGKPFRNTTRGALVGSVALISVAALAACGSPDSGDGGKESADGGQSIIIGSADFAESQLLASIYSQALQSEGIAVTEKLNIGSREVYIQALEDGSIDLIPEYDGYLMAHLSPGEELPHGDALTAQLSESLPEGLMILEPSAAENRDALVVPREIAEQYSLKTTSDLQPVAAELVLGGPPEWTDRFEGVKGLEEVYGLTFKEFQVLDAGGPLTLAALTGGQIHVGDMFTSDPAIQENNLVALEDDKGLFPSARVVPVIRESSATAEVVEILDRVSRSLTQESLMEMNGRISTGEDLNAIAADWLSTSGITAQ